MTHGDEQGFYVGGVIGGAEAGLQDGGGVGVGR